jgi:hypothetical protein
MELATIHKGSGIDNSPVGIKISIAVRQVYHIMAIVPQGLDIGNYPVGIKYR